MGNTTLEKMGRKKKPPRSAIKTSDAFAAKVRRLAQVAKIDPGDWLEREFGEAVNEKHTELLRELLKDEKKR